MFINEYTDTNFNSIISRIVPEKILGLNPIIAGGLPLAIYRTLKIYSGNEKLLFRDLERRMEPYGDIDMWFFHDDDIHKKGTSKSRILDGCTDFLENSGVVGHSKYAVSYRSNSTLGTNCIQIIKKPQNSINDLINSFDYINCSIAWNDGKVYISSELDSCFENFELRRNTNYDMGLEDSLPTMLFRSIRAFKYSDRYCLDFDSYTFDYIFNCYFKIKDIDIVSLRTSGDIIGAGPYSEVDLSDDRVYSMSMKMKNNFKRFCKTSRFKDEHIIYFIDSSFLPVAEKMKEVGILEKNDCLNNQLPF